MTAATGNDAPTATVPGPAATHAGPTSRRGVASFRSSRAPPRPGPARTKRAGKLTATPALAPTCPSRVLRRRRASPNRSPRGRGSSPAESGPRSTTPTTTLEHAAADASGTRPARRSPVRGPRQPPRARLARPGPRRPPRTGSTRLRLRPREQRRPHRAEPARPPRARRRAPRGRTHPRAQRGRCGPRARRPRGPPSVSRAQRWPPPPPICAVRLQAIGVGESGSYTDIMLSDYARLAPSRGARVTLALGQPPEAHVSTVGILSATL